MDPKVKQYIFWLLNEIHKAECTQPHTQHPVQYNYPKNYLEHFGDMNDLLPNHSTMSCAYGISSYFQDPVLSHYNCLLLFCLRALELDSNYVFGWRYIIQRYMYIDENHVVCDQLLDPTIQDELATDESLILAHMISKHTFIPNQHEGLTNLMIRNTMLQYIPTISIMAVCEKLYQHVMSCDEDSLIFLQAGLVNDCVEQVEPSDYSKYLRVGDIIKKYYNIV
jgi:hypothetical protein